MYFANSIVDSSYDILCRCDVMRVVNNYRGARRTCGTFSNIYVAVLGVPRRRPSAFCIHKCLNLSKWALNRSLWHPHRFQEAA